MDGETEITSEELQELRLDMQVIFVLTTFRLLRNQFNAIRIVNFDLLTLHIAHKSFSSDASLRAL